MPGLSPSLGTPAPPLLIPPLLIPPLLSILISFFSFLLSSLVSLFFDFSSTFLFPKLCFSNCYFFLCCIYISSPSPSSLLFSFLFLSPLSLFSLPLSLPIPFFSLFSFFFFPSSLSPSLFLSLAPLLSPSSCFLSFYSPSYYPSSYYPSSYIPSSFSSLYSTPPTFSSRSSYFPSSFYTLYSTPRISSPPTAQAHAGKKRKARGVKAVYCIAV